MTGHTGFKGAWLVEWLRELGAEVHGLALAPADPSLAALLGAGGAVEEIGDIRDPAVVRDAYARARPEVVFHLAAQALVRAGYRDPLTTFATNVEGTAHVLDAARDADGVRAIVVVTSDKVYDPTASAPPFDEQSPLGGADPYSSSKAAAELVTASYRSSFLDDAGVAVATARAGNVIGGGDWAPERIVPDVLRARAASVPVELRFPDAVRPWQHVLDPLHGYLLLAQRLLEDPAGAPAAVNFGPAPDGGCTVADLVERLGERLGGGGEWRSGPPTPMKETAELRLDSKLATKTLGWQPRLDLDASIAWTAEWHRETEGGADPRAVCRSQIDQFERLGA